MEGVKLSVSALFYAIGNCVLLHKKCSAKEAHLVELKLAVNHITRVQKSPANKLFIKQSNRLRNGEQRDTKRKGEKTWINLG